MWGAHRSTWRCGASRRKFFLLMTKLRIIGANGQRLAKSGKVVVKSVDLKVRDASKGKERTFKPTYEVADLGPEEDLIIGMDWMNVIVDSIKINPYGLVIKRLIHIVDKD